MYPTLDVVPAKRIAYLIMRKCGCSSVRFALSRLRDHLPVENSQSKIHNGSNQFSIRPDELSNPGEWFKFTFVREPIKRFLSFYSGKILDQNVFGNHTFLNYERFGLFPNMSLDQVIDVLLSGKFESEPHLVSQSSFINATNLEFDFIGKLEQLANGIESIKTVTGIELDIGHLNSSRNRYVLPSKSQFDRLVKYYRNDIETFGYPQNYDDWMKQNFQGKEKFYQPEPGFEFEDEGKLLQHSITRTPSGFQISMKWRVNKNHQRKRVVRLIQNDAGVFRLVWHIPPKRRLADQATGNMLVDDVIEIPIEKLPPNIDLRNLYHELFFTCDNAERADLIDYDAHKNMLVFSFGHLDRLLAKSA